RFLEDYTNPFQSHVFDMLYGSGAKDMGLYALFLPSYAPPGLRFHYISGNTNLLQKAMQRKMELNEYAMFAEENFFKPLEILHYAFEKDNSDVFIGSSNLFL